jgi:hypothetical protein
VKEDSEHMLIDCEKAKLGHRVISLVAVDGLVYCLIG